MSGISVRAVNPDDAEELLKIYSYYIENTAVSFEYVTPTAEEFRARIEKTLRKYPYFAVVQDGRITGYSYAGDFVGRAAYGWSAEMTIYLSPDRRRQGTGRLLYEKMEEALAGMGILDLYACIGHTDRADDPYLTNDSERFHERMGYSLVGVFRSCGYKFGRWYDMVWMGKNIGEHCGGQTEVIPYKEI